MALLRPSDLARAWGLHPKTVYLWIREGRLPAMKTPGAQYRVRTDDARAYCETNNLPMPRAVAAPGGTVAIVGKLTPTIRALTRACKSRGASVLTFPTVLDGLVGVAAAAPDVVAIDARVTDVKPGDAIRALRRHPRTGTLPIVVFGTTTRASWLKLGATEVVASAEPAPVIEAVVHRLEIRTGG
jgi:excisionase family DNA binding protein